MRTPQTAIDAPRGRRGRHPAPPCRRVEGWVEYRVADPGEGVAQYHLPHKFDRFYRADTGRDRRQGGSGIGLAIAKALVEAHGGGISATSPGEVHGATFTVRLPGATGEAPR